MLFAKTRREGILVEPYKQLRFGITFLIINLFFSFLLLAIFGYFIWDIYATISIYFQLDGAQNLMTLGKLIKPVLLGSVLVGFFIATTLVMSAKYTHQIYGPLVSIRRFLDELSEGRTPSPIALRSSDQLQDLATKLNQLAANKTFINRESKAKLADFVDCLVNKEKPNPIKLDPSDALSELGNKLNKLL